VRGGEAGGGGPTMRGKSWSWLHGEREELERDPRREVRVGAGSTIRRGLCQANHRLT
jgi:hypothetical protein